MKKVIWIGMGLLAFMLTACDQRVPQIPTDPLQVPSKDAEWVLAFERNNIGSYMIELHYTKEFMQDMVNWQIELILGETTLPLNLVNPTPELNYWSVQNPQSIGVRTPLKLLINNVVILDSHVTRVNTASAAFPNDYDYQQPLTLNWAVTSGNMYQFVRVEAFQTIVGEGKWAYDAYSKYLKQISATRRIYNFPANCVAQDGLLSNSVIRIGIQQVNYKIVGKTAVLVSDLESWSYSVNKSGRCYSDQYLRPIELHKILSEFNFQ